MSSGVGQSRLLFLHVIMPLYVELKMAASDQWQLQHLPMSSTYCTCTSQEGIGMIVDLWTLRCRVQDVRLTEIDKVELHCCFRPGDLVKAEVG